MKLLKRKADGNFYYVFLTVFFILSVLFAFTTLLNNINEIQKTEYLPFVNSAKLLLDKYNNNKFEKTNVININSQNSILDFYTNEIYLNNCDKIDYAIIGEYCDFNNNLNFYYRNKLSNFGNIKQNEENLIIDSFLDKPTVQVIGGSDDIKTFILDPKNNIKPRMISKLKSFNKKLKNSDDFDKLNRFLLMVKNELLKNPIDGFDEYDIMGLISQESDFRSNIYRGEKSILDKYKSGSYSSLINNCDSCEKQISEFKLSLIKSGGLKDCPAIASSGGLTQVLLPTARGYDKSFEFEDFFIPSKSIAIGITALKSMKKSVGVDDKNSVFVAYNGGPTRLRNLKSKFNGEFKLNNYFNEYTNTFKLTLPISYAIRVSLQSLMIKDLFENGKLESFDYYLDLFLNTNNNLKMSKMSDGNISYFYNNQLSNEIVDLSKKFNFNNNCQIDGSEEKIKDCIKKIDNFNVYSYELNDNIDFYNNYYSNLNNCYFDFNINNENLQKYNINTGLYELIINEPSFIEPNLKYSVNRIYFESTDGGSRKLYIKDGVPRIINSDDNLIKCNSFSNFVLLNGTFKHSFNSFNIKKKFKGYVDLGKSSSNYGLEIDIMNVKGTNKYGAIRFDLFDDLPHSIQLKSNKKSADFKLNDFEYINYNDLKNTLKNNFPFFNNGLIYFNNNIKVDYDDTIFVYLDENKLYYNLADDYYYLIFNLNDYNLNNIEKLFLN